MVEPPVLPLPLLPLPTLLSPMLPLPWLLLPWLPLPGLLLPWLPLPELPLPVLPAPTAMGEAAALGLAGLAAALVLATAMGLAGVLVEWRQAEANYRLQVKANEALQVANKREAAARHRGSCDPCPRPG